ncbi:hypothetical protein Tsubulata_030720 [Turnera subulata]|uniref:XS domain-containing protein n=1 Tax=Turnera subulata TaxID=218843 RepID=A0A9Q0FXP8_9ROSI|nr:hypothetical protein Tsubulata_030720 [Turnera subulata]
MSSRGVPGVGNSGGPKPNNLSWGDQVEQVSHGVAEVSLQDDGPWEVISKKSRNRGGNPQKSWPQPQNSNSRGHPDASSYKPPTMRNNPRPAQPPPVVVVDHWRSAGRGNISRPPNSSSSSTTAAAAATTRHLDTYHPAPQPAIRPPLQHGWNWQSRPAANQPSLADPSHNPQHHDADPNKPDDADQAEDHDAVDHDDDNDDEDDDDLDDSDDDLLSDDFDSDASEKSHTTRKNNRWFKQFFTIMDALAVEEINEPTRQWHCPACHGGPGAIDWYRGLQPLITHAKTKGSKRVRLHRELAELLEEELHRRGTSVIPAGEQFGMWKGLNEGERDHEIVWPPMVIIMNTRLEQDENNKWIGMGNQELLEYFNTYAAVRARHSYGPQGHRGMSVLIFESSARGYLEAERLHKHFAEQRMDRNAWDHRRVLFSSGGNRQLYGFLALKEDLDYFNQHSQGKSRLKYEMKSYHEMVVRQISQMTEDNQQLNYFKNKAVKEKRHSKALEKNFVIVTERLRRTTEEGNIVRQRTQMQHEENKEEMEFQEQFFKEQLKLIREERSVTEENFEKLQREKRDQVELDVKSSGSEEYRRRAEEAANFIKLQDKEMEAFVAERETLIKAHEDRMAKIEAKKKELWKEEVESEKEFDTQLAGLMKKYSQTGAEGSASY